MSEADWDTCTNPTPLLAFLRDTGKLSPRKARLFAVACCRRIWPLLTDERSQKAVEVAERYADGRATDRELDAAAAAADDAAVAPDEIARLIGTLLSPAAAAAAFAASVTAIREAIALDTETVAGLARRATRWAGADDRGPEEAAAQAALLRDLLGPLLFRPVALDPPCLTTEVVALAESIYARRAFDRLTVLATYLEDAGCDNPAVLEHLRSPGEHMRGCWAVDLVRSVD